MAGPLEELVGGLDPVDVATLFGRVRSAVPLGMAAFSGGLNQGEDEALLKRYGTRPLPPIVEPSAQEMQRRAIEEFELRYPTPELRAAILEQMRAAQRGERYDPSTATRRIDFAPHNQPGYKGPVATPSTGKRRFQVGGGVKSAIKKAKDVAASELWHGGTYRKGDMINRPLYTTPIRDLAQSYVDAKEDPGSTLQRLKPDVSKPAPERLVKAASRKFVPNNEKFGYTPASAFDDNLHDPDQIAEMIRELKRRGYDSAVAGDIGMPGSASPAPAGDALVVFPGKKAYAEGGGVGMSPQQMADEMLVKGNPPDTTRQALSGVVEAGMRRGLTYDDIMAMIYGPTETDN